MTGERTAQPDVHSAEPVTQRRSMLCIVVLLPALSFLTPFLGLTFCLHSQATPWGSRLFDFAGMALRFGIFPLLPTLLASLVLLFPKSTRIAGMCLLIAAVAYILGSGMGLQSGHSLRMGQFDKLVERSAPLVRAVHGYVEDTGHPPESLHVLVPDRLQKIPTTGMRLYPEFEYFVGEDAREWEGNPWILRLHTPVSFLNWDQLLYFPLQDYPDTGYSGRLERIGEWAYVHE